jgi:hypothetical protein
MKYTINGRELADDQTMSIKKKLLACHLKGIASIGKEDINTRHMKNNGMPQKLDKEGRLVRTYNKRPIQVFVEGKWRCIDWTNEYNPIIVMDWKAGHFRCY